ncbi:hypothetical protein FQN54_007121 [Arachnomyces sp. PD_36]|nr:hypothetical protein FQN54_007121 [Arachnomyces sp. PD_36]
MMGPSGSSRALSNSTTFILLLIIAIFASTAFSQDTLVPSSGTDDFPACAAKCPILKEAESSCLASPSSDRATHVSCLCQSALLTTLHSSPNGVCDASCPSPDDLQTLQSWYADFCTSGGEEPGDPTTGGQGSSPTGGSQGSGHQSWIEGHWRWVVMVVVLVVGFTSLGIGGAYLRRRYHRKHDPISTGSGMLPPPTNRSSSAMQQSDTWGPHQQTVHPRGAEFGESYLPHRSTTSTPDVTVVAGRGTPTSGNARLTRGRGMI